MTSASEGTRDQAAQTPAGCVWPAPPQRTAGDLARAVHQPALAATGDTELTGGDRLPARPARRRRIRGRL